MACAPRPLPFDELHRTVGQHVGEVRRFCHRFPTVEERIGARGRGVEVGMLAPQESEELIEAALHGMKPGAGSQMPFAEQGGPVARGSQAIGYCFLIERKPRV